MESLLLLLLGMVAGIVAGLFGLGGGILFTPILFVLFSDAGVGDPVVPAIASSLFCTFVASTGSTVRQYLQDNFHLAEGLKVGLMGVAGVSLGKMVITSPWYSKTEFVLLFSLLLLCVSWMFFRRGTRSPERRPADREPVTWRQSAVTGGLGGFAAALAGIGGGGVMVPLMNLLYRKEFVRSVSISSLAIMLISLSGWVQLGFAENRAGGLTPWVWGYVDFGTALPLAFGGLLGGFAGAWINLKLSRRVLQYAFALLALAMAAKMIAEAMV